MEIGLTDIETYTSIGANLVAITGIIVFIVEFNRYKKTNKIQAYQNRYQLYLEMDKILIERPELKKLVGNVKKELECSPKRKWEWKKKISCFSNRITDFLS